MGIYSHTFGTGTATFIPDTGVVSGEFELEWSSSSVTGVLQVTKSDDIPLADCKVTLGETDNDGVVRQSFRFAVAADGLKIVATSLSAGMTVTLRGPFK